MFTVSEESRGYTITGFGKIDQALTFNRFEGKVMIFNKSNGKECFTFVDNFLRGFLTPSMFDTSYYLTCDNEMTKSDVEKLVRDHQQTLQN